MSNETTDTNLVAERENYYELLLHSLTHQHMQANQDRHVLILEKWCRDFCDGLLIRDLPHVIEIVRLVHNLYSQNHSRYRKICTSVLRLCSKPVLETKSNERRKASTIENLGLLYIELVKFMEYFDFKLKGEVCRCFRCIINEGYDPMVLQVDQVVWESDGTRVQLKDRNYIHQVIRDNKILEIIAKEFLVAVDKFCTEKSSLTTTLITSRMNQLNKTIANQNKVDDDDSNDEVVTDKTIGKNAKNKNLKLDLNDLHSNVDSLKLEVGAAQVLAYGLLDLCVDLSSNEATASYLCRLKICNGAIKLIKLGSLDVPFSERDQRMPICVNLLWTVIESYLHEGKVTLAQAPATRKVNPYVNVEVMDFEAAVYVLREVMILLLREGHCMADKECRNEVAIVLTLIISFPAAVPTLTHTNTFIQFVTYGCLAEAANLRSFGTTTDIDIQFKVIIWGFLTEALSYNDPDMLATLASSPLLNTMFAYLEYDSLDNSPAAALHNEDISNVYTNDGNKSSTIVLTRDSVNEAHKTKLVTSISNTTETHCNNFIKQLSLVQLREIQLQAIKFLVQNAKRIFAEFLRIDGTHRIIEVICKYNQSRVREHKTLIYYGLLLIKNLLRGSNVIMAILQEEDAVHVFLFLLEFSFEERTKALAARLISMMCHNGNKLSQKQLRIHNGIKLLVTLVNEYSSVRKPLVGQKSGVLKQTSISSVSNTDSIEDPCEDFRDGDVPVYVVAVLDCIYNGVVGNSKNESKFADEEGLDKLLEILEVSPYTLRFPVLRLLSDLLENPLLIILLKAWRSTKTFRAAAQIIAHCWMDEELRFNGKRENGVLNNLSNPLGQHNWPTDKAQSANALGNSSVYQSASMGSSTQDPDSNSAISDASANRSLAVERLTNAISESRKVSQGSVPMHIRSQLLENDIRGIVAHIFHSIGIYDAVNLKKDNNSASLNTLPNVVEVDDTDINYDENEDGENTEVNISSLKNLGLAPCDFQVLSMALRYMTFREGEVWRKIMDELQKASIIPIEADLALAESRMEMTFDCAMAVQLEQMELQNEEKRHKQEEEKVFNENLIGIKNQQIKSEWLKKNRKKLKSAIV